MENELTAEQPIEWTGDLDDDCFARWGGMFAHAEAMSDEYWFCAVYTDNELPDELMHSSSDDFTPSTGEAARKICEWFMRSRDLAHEALAGREKIAVLSKFKSYVHARLDTAGVPVDPESPHKAEGCRIGGRLDWIEQQCKFWKAAAQGTQAASGLIRADVVDRLRVAEAVADACNHRNAVLLENQKAQPEDWISRAIDETEKVDAALAAYNAVAQLRRAVIDYRSLAEEVDTLKKAEWEIAAPGEDGER